MTDAEVLAMTIQSCNRRLEEQLEQTEAALIDAGADGPTIENWIGRDGYWRQKLEASRLAQIAEVKEWLISRCGGRTHAGGAAGLNLQLGGPINLILARSSVSHPPRRNRHRL
jgi:hypothetical protein